MYQPLENIVNQIITEFKELGYDIALFCGTRTFDQQAIDYAQGRTTAGSIITDSPPGYSWHDFGLAADLVFQVDGGWSWSQGLPWAKLGELAKNLGCEWGGDFTNIVDLDHIQFTNGCPIEKALEIYNQNNGDVTKVWAYVESLKNEGLQP